jgi:hypothetical protein
MESKQLQKWTLGAEICSALAVVITIGFLALQTMDNTNAVQAQTFQDLMRQTSEWRESVTDASVIELRDRWRDQGFQSLTRSEQLQIRSKNLVLWGIYESAYFANERGVLGIDEWTRFEIAICRGRERDLDYWDYDPFPSFSVLLTPRFAEYIESYCS